MSASTIRAMQMLPGALLAVLLGAIAFAPGAEAQFAKDIVEPDGDTVGGIVFPDTSGSSPEGVEFDFQNFTAADITAILWSLNPVTLEVPELNLSAFRGDSPCDIANAPCSNATLTLAPEDFSRRDLTCTGPVQGAGSCVSNQSLQMIALVSAGASLAKDIVDASGGASVGSIVFPGASGSSAAGIEIVLAGFTQTDITTASWTLDPVTLEVEALSLSAFKGAAACSPSTAPCSNTTLTLGPGSFSVGNSLCFPAQTLPGFCFEDERDGPISLISVDTDTDGIPDDVDNCLLAVNPDQIDTDGDAEGDACDPDDDGDGALDGADNCPLDVNADQADADGDGDGDACDTDLDGDGVMDAADACLPTSPGETVDASGCSVMDLCPCDNDWKNRGAYVVCNVKAASKFVKQGLITRPEAIEVVLASAKAQCGEAKLKSVIEKIKAIIGNLDRDL